MRFLTPLGWICLISYILLILIYLIKPTYQDKLLSSTYIWRRSLEFKKKTAPLSKFKNILQIILQVLAVGLCVILMCTPMFNSKGDDKSEQDIIILDKSASMLYEDQEGTCLDRAINKTIEMAESAINKNHSVSIITNDKESKFIVKKSKDIDEISSMLRKQQPSFYQAPIKQSIELANEMIKTNSRADVYVVGNVGYENCGDLNVVNVSKDNDWNVGILNVQPLLVDNYYEFVVDLMSYGTDKYVNVNISINNINHSNESTVLNKRVNCLDNKKTKVSFKDTNVFMFDNALITIEMDDKSVDGFKYDDKFKLFGGLKPELKIQYKSSRHNAFFSSALNVIRNQYLDDWNIDIDYFNEKDDTITSGYDFYIFENGTPYKLPKDGYTFIVNPDFNNKDFDKLGISLKSPIVTGVDNQFSIKNKIQNDILNLVTSNRIKSTLYTPIEYQNDDFETLWTINNDNVFVSSDFYKLSILSLDLNRSNLALLPDFPLLMSNIFNHFMTETIFKYVYNVGEEVYINSRGVDVKLKTPKEQINIDKPQTKVFMNPGEYEITENVHSVNNSLKFYVKIDNLASNCHRLVNDKSNSLEIKRPENSLMDGLMYFGISLAIILGIEKLLASKKFV